MRRLLSYRDARLLVAGQTLSSFGDWAMFIVMAVWMKSLTGSSARAGLVFFVLTLGTLVAGPLGGLLADRVKRRPLMIACDCTLGGSVLALLFVHDKGDAWVIYLVALLYGAVGTVFYPAQAALLRVMLPQELLADANGALSTMRQGLRLVAPLAGAGLYAAFGGWVVAILDAATFAGSAVLMSRMRVAEERPEPPEHHFLREVTAGIEHIWRTLPLRQMLTGGTVALLVAGFAETLIFSVIQHLGKPPSFFGVLGTLQGVGSIAGGVTAAAVVRRLGEMRSVGIGLALFGFGDLLLVVPTLPVVMIGFAIAGVGLTWAIVGYTTALQTRTPLLIQGRVSGAAELSLSVAQTVSIAAGAALSTVIDYRILLAAMAGVIAVSAVYLVTRREPPIQAEVAPLEVD
jgi:MFS family permease